MAGSGYGSEYVLQGSLRVGGELSGTLGVPTDYGTNSYYFALEDLDVGRYTVGVQHRRHRLHPSLSD